MIKVIFAIGLLFFFLGLTTLNANYTEDDLQNSIIKLKNIKSGDRLKERIDLFIKKYENDKAILIKFQKKLSLLENTLKDKTENKSQLLQIMIKYLSIKIYFTLDNLLKEEEFKKEIIFKEKEEKKQLIFPGFSDSYNDKEKNILAGKEAFVYAGGIGALYEKADISGIRFYVIGDNISDLKYAINKSYLYVEGLLLKTADYADIEILTSTKASITFDNIDNFIVPTDSNIDFRLAIKTNLIGYEKLGKTLKNLKVSDIDLFDVTGVTTGDSIVKTTISKFSSEYFNIIPSILNIKVTKDLYISNYIELNIKPDFGTNTNQLSNSELSIELKKLKFLVWGKNTDSCIYTLYNKEDSSDIITGVYNSGVVEFDLSSISSKTIGNQGERYIINISGVSQSIMVELLKDGIIYSVNGVSNSDNLNIKLEKNIDLGYRDF